MGFENRDYFRDGSYSERVAGFGLDFTPAVKWIILLNVAVFLGQIFFTRPAPMSMPEDIEEAMEQRRVEVERARAEAKKAGGDMEDDEAKRKKEEAVRRQQEEAIRQAKRMMEQVMGGNFGQRVSVVQEWCELDPQKVVYQGQVWRLLTCAFLHHRLAIWHILFNMVLLFWFGTRLENMYGSREFALFYLTAALCGSLAYVGLALYTGSNVPAIGASGAVMGVMMLYAIFYPFETITLFWILPVPIWLLLSLYVLYDLHPVLLALAGTPMYTGVAHAGHLGGLAFGYAYYKFGLRLEAPFDRGDSPAPRRRPAAKVRPSIREEPLPDDLNTQVDEILKKISEQGQASLTEQEKAVLQQASARYRGGR